MRQLIVFLFLMAVSVNAAAVMVFDAANFTQNKMAAINSMRALLNQAKELEYQVGVYQSELKNLANYSKGIWGDNAADLNRLAAISKKGQAIAYSVNKLEEEFTARFPGYQRPKDYQSDYKKWSQTTLDTLKNTLLVASQQANDFARETEGQRDIQALSSHATGNLQALQASNMLASAQIDQMQKLRQLIMTQLNAQNAFFAYQVTQDQAQVATRESWINHANTKMPHYGSGRGFGVSELHV